MVGVKVPEPDEENVTVPVGVPYPVTVAVQMVELPTPTVLGLQTTLVVEVVVLTVSENVPELPPLFESPPYVAVMV